LKRPDSPGARRYYNVHAGQRRHASGLGVIVLGVDRRDVAVLVGDLREIGLDGVRSRVRRSVAKVDLERVAGSVELVDTLAEVLNELLETYCTKPRTTSF